MSLFYVLYVHCMGRAVTNVGKTCGPTPCLTRAINMFKLNKKGRHDISHLGIVSLKDGSVKSRYVRVIKYLGFWKT